MNFNTCLILLPTKLHPHEPRKFWLPKNIDPHKKNMIPQFGKPIYKIY